ncbi:MAG TPA: hypothetical protein DGQ94_13395 [Pseudomonas sp.]|nr:hypothetical protein [Pseudomonas sp.]
MLRIDGASSGPPPITQALLLQPKSPASILMMTSMHELETLRALLESALIQVRMPTGPRTFALRLN